MASVELRGLKKDYGKGEHTVHALDGIDLSIEQGDFVAVIGRSGSGKTTLLDCVGLLLRPTAGQVLLDGADAGGLSDRRRAEMRGRRLGFIFQDFNLLSTLTARENVLLPMRYTGGINKTARARADSLLEEVGLAARGHHRATELSGGEQQRVAIARALVNEPTLVLGDEPTGEVDTETREELIQLMLRMNRERETTFVIVTHDVELAGRARRMIRLKDGQVLSDERLDGAKGTKPAAKQPAAAR